MTTAAATRTTFTGLLAGIQVSHLDEGPQHAYDEIAVVAGERLGRGPTDRLDEAVTLIESEALAAVLRETGRELTFRESRRNLLTEGVPLTHLVGRRFAIGDEVVLEGVDLSEPCGKLERLTNRRLITVLRHRGGLECRIVEPGTIRVGDVIRPLP